MASAAILRSATRSLRLRRPLDQQAFLLARRSVEGLSPTTRLLSSSVPTERHTSSEPRSSDSKRHRSHTNMKKEDIYEPLSTKIDRISDGFDEQKRLLKQIEDQIKENNKHGGPIDLTPWVVSSFALFVLYNYMQG